MADLDENAKKRLDAQRAAAEKSREDFAARTKGKPTPTQDENDRAKMGEHITEHEPDGSDLDEAAMPIEHRQMEARHGSGGGYQTRTMSPQQRASRPVQSGGSSSSSS